MKQKREVQQVINSLTERALAVDGEPCKLGHEPLSRRGGMCSVCTAQREFELDQAIAELIGVGAFRGTGVCPYRAIASHLVAGLLFGPEAFRARSADQYRIDPARESEGALKHIRKIIRTTRLTRDDIKALSQNNDRREVLDAVFTAEQALETALATFRSQTPSKAIPRARGRIGGLHIQAIARSVASAWRIFTGRLPAKGNTQFHALLNAAVATVFGHPAEEPNWESATRIAVKRLKKDATSRS